MLSHKLLKKSERYLVARLTNAGTNPGVKGSSFCISHGMICMGDDVLIKSTPSCMYNGNTLLCTICQYDRDTVSRVGSKPQMLAMGDHGISSNMPCSMRYFFDNVAVKLLHELDGNVAQVPINHLQHAARCWTVSPKAIIIGSEAGNWGGRQSELTKVKSFGEIPGTIGDINGLCSG